MLDLKHISMEARGSYLNGPVELLIQREEQKVQPAPFIRSTCRRNTPL